MILVLMSVIIKYVKGQVTVIQRSSQAVPQLSVTMTTNTPPKEIMMLPVNIDKQ
jgi:hypothetical protein